ncbi:hypothetical protein GGS23DRAFT_570041 [Durotheca rogersii]|uniref:uncharacterized protein n=1 Tax=Durotheca rogersii TaxID=419775 RepID=UPI00221FB584|nr:uncharacterized protein GGS23DRAFT_570041 [Durotheca rogersii]KAI5862901.1 hypothetical protein GGS23DRAFT_570041 [Durotheca rogersii]
MPNNIIPVPYQAGKTLQLQVLQNCCSLPFSQSVTATISKTFDITMSPVMDVIINTRSGSRFRAVLKLYDRRFGIDLRRIRNRIMPLITADEAEFQSFVRRGKMGPFISELEEEKKTEILPRSPSHFHDDTPEGNAKYEAALWQSCVEYFDCETEAYARLRDLQGRSIPRMYAHVRLVLGNSDVPRDLLQSPMARYFEIKGVLLELIHGYNLSDLPTSPLAPSDPKKWPGIVQSAVDFAHEINRRGVLMGDCAPRNVVVDKRSQTPFIIDLAQCGFKDKMIEAWKEWDEDEDWDPDVDYCEQMITRDNPGAIGAVMRMRLQRIKGMELDINYPNCMKIIDDIKRCKAGRATRADCTEPGVPEQ